MKHRLLVPLCGFALLAACDSPTRQEDPVPEDPRLAASQRVVDVANGFSTTCALTEAGQTFCWGENRFGEFGDGTRTSSPTPVLAAGGLAFTAITGTRGTSRLCGITAAGEGWCAGYNINGELGDSSTVDRWAPARVHGGVQFREIATSYHTCGVAVDGRAYCWGLSMGGALGYVGGNVAVPNEVDGGLRFTSITVGMLFSCGLTAAGAAYCWGWGSMLGNGSDQERHAPVAVADTFAAISAGEEHACGLTLQGEAWCWGKTEPPFGRVRLVPERVPHEGRPLRRIAAGSTHTCALDDQGRALCWIGGAPVAVPTDVRFAGLDSGRDGTCAYTEGGALYCWEYGAVRPTPTLPARVPAFPAG